MIDSEEGGANCCGTHPQAVTSRRHALDMLMSSPHTTTSAYVLPVGGSGGGASQAKGTKLQLIVAREFGKLDSNQGSKHLSNVL